MSDNESSRSWFCVLNNPSNLFGEDKTPEEMVKEVIEIWCHDKPQRTCAVNYEIGDSGTPHMHMVLEDPAKVRFSTIKNLFPKLHIEPTRGTKKQAEDYILKRGRFEEKNHTVIVPAIFHGEISAAQGTRNDLLIIEDLIAQGKTPTQIMDISFAYRKHESLIRKAYIHKQYHETPPVREITVYWHVGESGCGKSYSYTKLIEQYGEENIYHMSDYVNGGFDMYEAQKVLFMDEYKGDFRFQQLLTILDKYKAQIHCRYANTYALWTEVHITSIFPPEEVYSFMVEDALQSRDNIQQLLRRLSYVIYHYKEDDSFKSFTLPASLYINYNDLKQQAYEHNAGFFPVDCEIPFR